MVRTAYNCGHALPRERMAEAYCAIRGRVLDLSRGLESAKTLHSCPCHRWTHRTRLDRLRRPWR